MNNFLKIIQQTALPNKYTKWYIGVIDKALIHGKSGYTENHHIVPKSFAKILNINDIHDSENLVELSAKEHFICHMLLTKMFSGVLKQKMMYAIHRLAYSDNGNKPETYVSCRKYETIRKQHSLNISGAGNPMFGKLHSNDTKTKMSTKAKKRSATDATRKKMSESHKGDKNFMFGKTHTPEARRKISENQQGMSSGKNNHFYGKTHSDETKARLGAARKAAPKTKCTHCNKLIDPSNYKRWHGDNCKIIRDQLQPQLT